MKAKDGNRDLPVLVVQYLLFNHKFGEIGVDF
jgi:hypothetical protein